MRLSMFGVIPNLPKVFNYEISLEMFKRMCLVRCFEGGVVEALKDGRIKCVVYLSTGQESISAAMSLEIADSMIFSQHRCHATYLSFGGDPAKLRDELLGMPGGTSGGRAGSNCLQNHDKNVAMYGHHGLIGENVPLAVGAALGSGKPTVCFFGDGSAEEDYVLAAMGFAVTHKLPVLFVCEDNNLSILTPVDTRRGWSMTNVAKSFGMPAYETADDPWTVYLKTQELKTQLPAFINIHTCRSYWHAGAGIDGPPEWDRYAMVKDELENLGLTTQMNQIETTIQRTMEELWDKRQ